MSASQKAFNKQRPSTSTNQAGPSEDCTKLLNRLKTRDRLKLKLETTIEVCNNIADMTVSDFSAKSLTSFCRYESKAMLELLQHNFDTIKQVSEFDFTYDDAKGFRKAIISATQRNNVAVMKGLEEIVESLCKSGLGDVGKEITEKFEGVMKANNV
ncbi:hypothetical protein PMZ80_001373 [Knufia obscura]|uniref:Uncharacterized protein n=1 Tax=Knufia obscura TaxID=1635080 RepID=A0ABR0S3X6_9EURO|nr:hypothetical protein PMZ80_001373 [Knufia obscura]